MKIDNPYENKKFDTVAKDKEGNDEYGFRTVDGVEEVVHIPSGKSNMTYYSPQPVLRPEGCAHVFNEVNGGLREYVCNKCNYGLTAHITQLNDLQGTLFVTVGDVNYPVN